MKTVKQTYSRLIITGGSSGIGASILQRFLNEYTEAQAINLSRTKPQLLPETGRCHHIPVDLSQADQVEGAATDIQERLRQDPPSGPILLVNNSGIGTHAHFQAIPQSTHLKTIDLNIAAPVHLTLKLLPELLKHSGKIVTVASTSAFQPTPRMATYGATKTFLLNWTLALGEDLRGTGVSTLAFCPGATQTAFIRQAGFDKPVRSFWGVQSVDSVTASLFAYLHTDRKLLIPGKMNHLMAGLAKTAPYALSTRVAGWLMDWAKRTPKTTDHP